MERLARRLKASGEAGDAPRKESCLWANALASKLLLAPARSVLDRPDVLQRVSVLLNSRLASDEGAAAATRLGQLEIKEFRIGEHDPLIRWVEAVAESTWELRVEWEEPAELAVESSLIICWPPRQPIALLPFSFSFAVKGLEATLRLELETAAGPPRMALSLLPEQFRLDLDIHSLVGHRSKLKDMPKLTAIIYSRIRQSLHHHILFPNRVHFNADLGEALSAQLAALVPPKSSPPIVGE